MRRLRGPIPHLFREWGSIAKRIRENKRLVLLFDFDGTLVQIAPLPGRVRLANGVRRTLQRLVGRRDVTLAVISGRRRAELQRHIGIRGIKYLGLYGWESDGNAKLSAPVARVLARAFGILLRELSAYPGLWIEPKRCSFSVHLLGASPHLQQRVRRMVMVRLKPLRKTLRVIANLRDLEVVPVSLGDKGVAVRKFLGGPARSAALPIYFGDDFSDEPAFAAARNGITILVGRRRATQARFFLRGPAEVAATLSRMEAILR